ncbi:hypothetical protein DL766_003405 [Monosporascus sp. MC13-8B]|uniref:Uncharacterized protein n=1 Tax=Monosporascus cannonballus TaxID=155416 RepID=A0ABY0GUY3_9PEZI|nr:hypothetical protein DL762_008868 [Monosporascus cannonballus]RYO79751.1 hypothetical protein DL763_009155 [Monosporascus cannonballus]RYP33569.1 hypothetical protein DL766_003405 [Monosporascus sp. MC13-8B]
MYIKDPLSPLILGLLMTGAAAMEPPFNVTAISARYGKSRIECWQLDSPFTVSTQPGIAGGGAARLGDVSEITWVAALSGLGYITVPGDKSNGLYGAGGEILFVADTANVSLQGHRSLYPGVTETIVLQIPTRNGEIPSHNVLHQGPCSASEVARGRGLGI